jgi:hypothetical protein
MSRTGLDFFLDRFASPDQTPVEGGSGYFSAPEATLDPHLFAGDRLLPDVRQMLLSLLYTYWETKYNRPREWSTLWLAGSGISYQWSADRGNGDLDGLMGVDFVSFYTHNPDFQGVSENDMCDIFNSELHRDLWPATANTNINGQTYEVTYYVNPGATDIRDINPYAAYDVTHDAWTVRPPILPKDPATSYPREWWEAVGREGQTANDIIQRYNTLRDQIPSLTQDSPQWHNALRAQRALQSQAAALFDDIHLGRKIAFSAQGQGYGDYHNFRWQVSKQKGYGPALNAIAHGLESADEAEQTELYGSPLTNAHRALTTAALWNRR